MKQELAAMKRQLEQSLSEGKGANADGFKITGHVPHSENMS
jgi:hypothetical protein